MESPNYVLPLEIRLFVTAPYPILLLYKGSKNDRQ